MTTKTPVVFIHGLWMHASSWDRWAQLFNESGFDAIAPSWPGDSATVAQSNAHPELLAGFGVDEVTEHFAQLIRSLDRKPIVIGHSFGGLIAQKLLAQDLAVAAVAIDPAQFRGVLPLPFAQLKSALPVLGNPANYNRAVALTGEQFASSFASAVPAAEAFELHAKFAIPAPGRPLFQAAAANFNPRTSASVDVNAKRGPLLITGGGRDRVVPAVTTRAAFAQYRKASTTTEYREFADRGHSLAIDHGWREVADVALAFLAKHGLK